MVIQQWDLLVHILLKMQTTVLRENHTITQRKKDCSKFIVGDTSPFIVKSWLVPRLETGGQKDFLFSLERYI